MKKSIVYILSAALLCVALSACGDGSIMGLRPDTDRAALPEATNGNTVSPSPAVTMPDRDDGIVRDDDGIITDDDTGSVSGDNGNMQHRSAAEPSMKPDSSALPDATPGNNHP